MSLFKVFIFESPLSALKKSEKKRIIQSGMKEQKERIISKKN
jgi:hypothetical protein